MARRKKEARETERPRKSSDERLRERLRQAGFDVDQELPAFLFVISGKTTVDVSLEFANLAKALEAIVEDRLSKITITSSMSGIVFFPTILNPGIANMPDYISHRRDRTVYAGLNIDHARWVRAGQTEKIELLGENIRNSLLKVKETYLSPQERTIIIEIVDLCCKELSQAHLH